jgi:hypothetical protein
MRSQLRDLVASALYPTKAYSLPAVCERYGLDPGDEDEAFSSKTRYVMRRLEKLSDEQVLEIARQVVHEYPHDALQAAIEELESSGRLLSDLSRQHLAEALNTYSLGGKRDLMELLRKHFPSIDQEISIYDPFEFLADDIERHVLRNNDWDNFEVLERAGFLKCSQAKLFQFLEDVLNPIRRDHEEQEDMVAVLNPILRRDGYVLAPDRQVSGYPVYTVKETTATGAQPADTLISQTLISFDEGSVHHAWQKALDRRARDPEGAITAAKTLLESVCKNIIEEDGGSYGEHDDLPKLYRSAAERLNLAPSQHNEEIFRTILGNCQSVVGSLAGLRNKLGDSHGQGRRHVKPSARHAELAVNLAGSMSMFLVSTWTTRKG